MKVITVVGARPQFIKAAALSPCLADCGQVEEVIVHTGQHYDASMSDVFFEEMKIPRPKYNLGVGGGSHGQNTGRMIEGVEQILLEERPSAVLVYGDTDSTLAAAIAASKLGIYLVHVEAGLRSFRRAMPEEINRVLTDHVSDVLYASSQVAADHLIREGISTEKIVITGDIMCDTVRIFSSIAKGASQILGQLGLESGKYHLLTLHRKENTDDPAVLQSVINGLAKSDFPIVFPAHPRTADRISKFGFVLPGCVIRVDPLGYLDTLQLLSNCKLLLTDSGGMQKEAYFLERPCVTLRDETEWVELVDQRVNVLVGASAEKIGEALRWSSWPSFVSGIYGDGMASRRIADDMVRRLSNAEK